MQIIKKMFKENNKYYMSIVFVVFFFFRQLVYYIDPEIGYQLVGNLDLFYLFGLVFFFSSATRKNKKTLLLYAAIFLCYLVLQVIFLNGIVISRAIINIAKIFLCYFVFRYFVSNRKKMDLKFITIGFGILCAIFLVVALICYNNGFFWRLNDTINAFDFHRLKLFYTEPGELGMHCAIMAVLATSTLLDLKEKKVRYAALAIIPVIICLIFTRSLGGILIGGVAVFATIFTNAIAKRSKKSLIIFISTVICLAVVVIVAVLTNNTLYLRTKSALQNADSSSRYRITTSFTTSAAVIKDTHFLGAGFGNLELAENVSKYGNYGLESAGVINSFMNFISEGGILAICIVVYLILKLVVVSFKSKDPARVGIALFIVLYQFMGTYFTNPLCWICYAFVLYGEKKIRDKNSH